MRIRNATKNDIANLVRLMQIADNRTEDWAQDRVIHYLYLPDQQIFLAENDTMIGYAGINCSECNAEARKIIGDSIRNYACLAGIASHPGYRNQGVARNLIDNCQKWSARKGRTGMWLDCREKLIKFYEKLGFRNAGSYMDNDELRFVFVKEFELPKPL